MENKPSEQDKYLYFLDYAPAYRLKLIKQLVGPVAGKTVADIGCGKSSISFLLWTLGAKVYSFDISAEALRVTRSLGTPDKGDTKFDPEICQCDARTLPLAQETFDVVCCFETLEHLQNEGDRTAIREMERIAKPGARIVLSVPYTRKEPTPQTSQRYRHYSFQTIKTRLITKQMRLERAIFWYFPVLALLEKMKLRYINAVAGSLITALASQDKQGKKNMLRDKDAFTYSLMKYYNTVFWRKIVLPAILILADIDKLFKNLPYSNDIFLIMEKRQ